MNQGGINNLPDEILDAIFHEAVKVTQKDNVLYTFGLSQLPPCRDETVSTKPQKYVRGPIPPYQRKWDATSSIRLVCQRWHDWSLHYALSDVYVKLWRNSERWLDLTSQRGRKPSSLYIPVHIINDLQDKYPLYELNVHPKGEKVYRDQYQTLRTTRRFLEACPRAASNVRRLWFNGLYAPETDAEIFAIIQACPNVTRISAPWTLLRHGSPDDWAALLRTDGDNPLLGLELLATRLSDGQNVLFNSVSVLNPFTSDKVDFSQLRRLKLFGNTTSYPVCDDDLKAIARTAKNLQEFQMTCISTVTMEGVMAIVRSSRKTIRVLEHSPRSDDGFWHPHPGTLSSGEHICDILTSCPKLEHLSISIPTMCSKLFSNYQVRWKGDCQVRALGLCSSGTRQRSNSAHDELGSLLEQARRLRSARASGAIPEDLTLELFFANMIFDPHLTSVHGDFQEAEFLSNGTWPGIKTISRKGPYGSSGLYGKDDEYTFDCITEQELFAGLARNMLHI